MSDEAAPTGSNRTLGTDEVLRRVGRNLVTFQQVEYVLKFLATHSRFHAPASKFIHSFNEHAQEINKRTMGGLAGRLVDTVLQADVTDPTPDAIDEAWLGFRFTIETDAETVVRHEAAMKELVDRRNELVHDFLPRWQQAVAGEVEPALIWLDAQREAAVAMLDRLKGWARAVDTARLEQAAFLASEEGLHQMDLLLLRDSRLVQMLVQIAMATPRTDGWTLLASAGHLIKREAPDELENLRGRFGQASLKAVLLAAEMFDVIEEATPSGVSRTIYRVNQRWRRQGPLTGSAR